MPLITGAYATGNGIPPDPKLTRPAGLYLAEGFDVGNSRETKIIRIRHCG